MYFCPSGWRYYLPAYIVWSLRQYINSDSIADCYTRAIAQEAMEKYWNRLCQAKGSKNDGCAHVLNV